MKKIKINQHHLYKSALLSLLFCGVYLTFYLQKDFLVQIGLTETIAIMSILFFDLSKIFCEILIFFLSWRWKIVMGFYLLILITVSVFATWVTRIWHSEYKTLIADSYMKVEKTTIKVEDQKKELIKQQVDLIKPQLESIEEQIRVIRDLIAKNTVTDKGKRLDWNQIWISDKYVKDLEEKQKSKKDLLDKVEGYQKELLKMNEESKGKIEKPKDEKNDLLAVINIVFGSEYHKYVLYLNLSLAILLEITLLFICSVLAKYRAFIKNIKVEYKEEIKATQIESKSVPEELDNLREREVTERADGIRKIRDLLGLSQQQLGDVIGESQLRISQFERGVSKIDNFILDKIEHYLQAIGRDK